MALSAENKRTLAKFVGDNKVILNVPVKVKSDNITCGTTEINKVYKSNKSWKIGDVWDNEWTLSVINPIIVWQIMRTLLTQENGAIEYVQGKRVFNIANKPNVF